MAKVRVKYLQPHGDHAHCTYGVLTSAAADKLEPASSGAALGQEG
jgi:hypothetical protein